MEPSGGSPIDGREFRAVQGTLGVALLGAFVFGLPLVVAAVFVLVAAGAALGTRGSAPHALYRALTGGRLAPSATVEDAADVRLLDTAGAVLLGLGTAALLVGVGVVGWLLTLVVAAAAVVAASTGINVAVVARTRLHRD